MADATGMERTMRRRQPKRSLWRRALIWVGIVGAGAGGIAGREEIQSGAERVWYHRDKAVVAARGTQKTATTQIRAFQGKAFTLLNKLQKHIGGEYKAKGRFDVARKKKILRLIIACRNELCKGMETEGKRNLLVDAFLRGKIGKAQHRVANAQVDLKRIKAIINGADPSDFAGTEKDEADEYVKELVEIANGLWVIIQR